MVCTMTKTLRWSALWAGMMAILVSSAGAAVFVNGGFEDGTFNGWTKNGGYWYGGIGNYNYSGDPGRSAIVGVGNDPVVTNGGGALSMVHSGNYSARVNNYDPEYHFSTITQTVYGWSDPHIYFAWAAVLQEPEHGHSYEPHFRLTVNDLTTSTVLYSVLYAADTLQSSILHTIYAPSYNGTWKYTDWQVQDIDTSNVQGHDIQLTLLAADCAYGGHGGYVSLDGFSRTDPTVPEPATIVVWSLLGGLAVTIGWWRRRRAT
jgi:hypothetical protein